MKKVRLLAAPLLVTILLINAEDSNGQLSMDFIYGGLEDTEILLQEYIQPYANVLGANLNAGWYHTAKPHKLGGFDITATVSWAFAPPSALDYDLSTIPDLNASIEGDPVAPTAAGSMDNRPDLVYSEEVNLGVGGMQEVEIARFTHPNGSGLNWLPLPMAQLSVGLPKGTDVTVRYIPAVRYRDYGEIGLWGVGGKHSISQWIPVIKKLPILDISIQGGYTNVSSAAHLGLEPLPVDIEPDNIPDWDDQYLNLDVQGWTVNLIASQTVPVLTFYQAIGYSNSIVDISMTGHYPMHTVITEGGQAGSTTYTVEEDPLAFNVENFRNLRLNAGVRVKLGVLTLHYDYTYTLYSTHTAGIGISFR